MACGLPQAIDYDTSLPKFMPNKPTFHSFPLELHIILIEINKRHFQTSAMHDWKDIERRLLTWQSPAPATPDGDSWKTIAQLTVHESWRQTLLIYLYMVSILVF